MIDPSPHAPKESHADWLKRQRLIRQFEEAWQQQPSPALEDYLPADPTERRPILVELVHTDLEYRLKAGSAARVEDYLTRYPELAANPETVLELVLAEVSLRRRIEPELTPDEYHRRFPQLRAELEARWRAEGLVETPRPVAWTCPDCRNLIEGAADPLQKPMSCPWCGTVVQLRPAGPALGAPPEQVRLGKYQLQEVVGRGTFGIVYRAHDTELDRTVAVKVPRLGTLTTPEDEDRFLREARSAAQLKHPNIVTVYDAGKIDATCYLAGEFVRGTTLAARLRMGRLTFAQAAGLMARVAEAVHYAHEQGVIHRDLKPSNVLLDVAGEPHVFDFGLAKREVGDVSLTLDGQVLGTPAYMAPEQARGEAARIGACSDVYSLGVMLYELLTGDMPFHGNVRMVLKQVLEEEPRPPRRLNDRIPRDLETICLKAMAKEPRLRYPTAAALGEDLHRWLKGEPIHARPAGRIERLARWCRRNPRVAVLSSLVLGLLVLLATGSTVAAVWIGAARNQAERERQAALASAQRAQESEAAARSSQEKAAANARAAAEHLTLALDSLKLLVGDVQKQLLAKPGTLKVGQKVAETALKGLERIAHSAEKRPVADRAMVTAHQQLGDIFSQLVRRRDARKQYERARDLAKDLLKADAGDAALKSQLAGLEDKLGFLAFMEGDLKGAQDRYQKAFELRKELAAAQRGDERIERALAVSYNKLAEIRQYRRDPLGARAYYEEGLRLREAHVGATHDRNLLLDDLRFGYGRLGDVCLMVGEFDQAAIYYQKALETMQTWAAADPANPICRHNQAGVREKLGVWCLAVGKPADAESWFRQAVAIKEGIVAADPENMKELADLSYSHQLLGDALVVRGDLDAARAEYQRAKAMGEKLVARDPTVANGIYVADPLRRLAAVEERQEHYERAAAWSAEALDLYRRGAKVMPNLSFLIREFRQREESSLAVYTAAALLWEGHLDMVLNYPGPLFRQPRVVVLGLLRLYAFHLANQGRHREAVAAAERYRALAPANVYTLEVIARVYARCATALDRVPPSEEISELRQRYVDTGVQALLAVLDLPRYEVMPDFLPPELEALRAHPGFQKFLREWNLPRPQSGRAAKQR
jgi:tetratricopeptide (TPR) repeat protein